MQKNDFFLFGIFFFRSRDILDSGFYNFSGTVNYVITFLICIIQKGERLFQKGKRHSSVF